MGYSARYHTASLIAVFVALAVGILIGVGLGENVVSGTEERLRESLEHDLEEARGSAQEARDELGREREFGQRAYSALVTDVLDGRRVAVIAFGDLDRGVSDDIERALEPTGVELGQVLVIRMPPQVDRLAESLAETRFARLERRPGMLRPLGVRTGRQLARGGGPLLERARDALVARSSGEPGRLNGVVLVGGPAEDADAERLAQGVAEGLRDAGAQLVAVERSDSDPSAMPFFSANDVTTSDSVDLVSGRAAMVFSLLGAEGNFGIKDTADRLLPELLAPRGAG